MAGLLVGSVFTNAARAAPDRVAAAFRNQTITFGELDGAANRLARTLTAQGMRHGDRVAGWSGTSLEQPILFAALARIGAVFAPVNGLVGRAEAARAVSAIDATWLIADSDHHVEARGLCATTLEVSALVAASQGEDSEAFDTPGLLETDPHVIYFTSGSSGAPKGVVVSHRVSMLRTLPGAQLEPRGAMVCAFPLFHMAGWTVSMQQWQARDTVVYLDRADGPEMCEAVQAFAATRLYCVPAVWQRVLDELDRGDAESPARLPTLRFADTGTSTTSPELLDAIAAAAPRATVRVFYGSTEAGNVASATREQLLEHPGSCGVPAGLTETRINGDGELEVRGPLLFDGYLGGAAADVFDDGWFRTGDLADVDADGYLRITGRTGDVIRTGGESVVPDDVEAVLAGYPGTAEIAVIGLPDERWGELVCAVVVPKTGSAAPTLDQLRAWCDGQLAPFQQPRALRVVVALPRTAATGKVQRGLLARSLTDVEG